MCCLWTYVVCSWRNWVHWQILSLTLSKWRWPDQLLAVAFDRAKPCATTGPVGLGLLWWPRRSVLTAKREMHEKTACIPKAYCMQKYAPDWTIWGPKCVGGGLATPSPRSVATLPRKVAIFLGIFYLKCWEVCSCPYHGLFIRIPPSPTSTFLHTD